MPFLKLPIYLLLQLQEFVFVIDEVEAQAPHIPLLQIL